MVRHVAAVGLMVWAGTAQAMLAPCYYDKMIREAVTVVQVERIEVGVPDDQGYCAMTSQVARSFRGDLALGDMLRVSVPCEPDGTVGGTIWTSAESIGSFPVAEVHLAADGAIAAYGFGLILLPNLTDVIAWRPITTEICE
jgi:hypothetical protein